MVRGWTHLERQRGGLGKTGGPGEKQIETRPPADRRARQAAAASGSQRWSKQRAHAAPRARRAATCCRSRWSGYTNAGKSTLFNALTRAGAYAADQLFATLDTTSRACSSPGDGATSCCPTPSASSATCRTQLVDGVPVDARGDGRGRPAAARGRRASPARDDADRRGRTRCWPRSAPPTCRRSLVFNKIDRSTARRRSSATPVVRSRAFL
ncbi:MAG: 50S ribosome-binding GTPase [Comamonadaceae bacterium]|nr:50S ribosome-binding GTPase [Comamonadaceae bacterium]